MKKGLKKALLGIGLSVMTLGTSALAGCNPVDNVKGWVDQIFCKHETTEIVEAVAPTCTEDGYTEYEKCTDCGKEVTKGAKIEATGHTIEVTKGYAATCTTMGLTDKKTCTVCEEVIEEAKRIPVLGHKKKEVKAVAATCTEAGHTAGVICENGCGTIYSGCETIPATGLHNYKDGECTVCGEGPISAAELEAGVDYTGYVVRFKYDESTSLEMLRSVGFGVEGYIDGGIKLVFQNNEEYVTGIDVFFDCDTGSFHISSDGLSVQKVSNGLLFNDALLVEDEDLGFEQLVWVYTPSENVLNDYTEEQLNVLFDLVEFCAPDTNPTFSYVDDMF